MSIETELQQDTNSSERTEDQNKQTGNQKAEQKPQSPEEKRKAAKRKRILIVSGSLVALALITYGVYYMIWSAGHQETDDAYVTGHLHPISSRVVGTVTQVLVDDNDHVDKGQTLVVLDSRDLQTHVDQAAAALERATKEAGAAQATIRNSHQTATAETLRANGNISEAKATIEAQKAQILAAQAGVVNRQARLDQSTVTLRKDETDLHRYEDLAAKEQISRQTLDHARATYQVSVATQAAAEQSVGEAQAKLSGTKEELNRAQSLLTVSYSSLEGAKAAGLQTDVRTEQFETAKAAVAQAKVALRGAQLQLSYSVIGAPVSGRIGRKSVESGQRLQIGQPLMAIIEDEMWVVANYKETQLHKMKPQQEVEVKIDTFPKNVFRGRVQSIAPGSGNQFALLPPENATGNFTKIVQRIPVKIVLDRDSLKEFGTRLVPGMSTTVTVTTK